MEVVRAILIVIEGLIGILLVGVILLQRARNEGLGLAFGAQVGETLFGSRAGNVLTRVTVWLGSAFIVATVVLAFLYSGRSGGVEKVKTATAASGAPTMPAPKPFVPGMMTNRTADAEEDATSESTHAAAPAATSPAPEIVATTSPAAATPAAMAAPPAGNGAPAVPAATPAPIVVPPADPAPAPAVPPAPAPAPAATNAPPAQP